MKGAWYARGGTLWKDFWTLLHPPYTSMVLAYVTIGGCLSPTLHTDRLVGLLLAYLLGLGGAAHFLDETRGHPWGTGFSNRTLYFLTFFTLTPAAGIGLYYSWAVSPWFLSFVILGMFFAFAYNLEWFKGRFHTDLWFAISWGGLPFLTSYYLQTLSLQPWAFVLAATLACTAGIQITLSRWIKGYRRGPSLAALSFLDGRSEPLQTDQLIARPQRALKLIVYTVDLLAIALLLRHFIPE